MSGVSEQTAAGGFQLVLSDRAAAEVKKFIETEQVPVETAGLRVSVLPGGCSGFKRFMRTLRNCAFIGGPVCSCNASIPDGSNCCGSLSVHSATSVPLMRKAR